MPSRIVSIPFVLGALIFLYLTWEIDRQYSAYIVPFVIGLALIFSFSPQINWWWYQRHPPELTGKLRGLLERFLPYYQRLAEPEKKRFRHRVALYIEANDFMAKGMDEVSPDLKVVAAACAVQLTFGKRDFLLNRFEHLIFFPQPFPSPQYPENYHASEIYEEDGAILFSAEQLMKGFFTPHKFYNIGLHEYAKVFERSCPALTFPALADTHWQELQQISGFTREWIREWINLEDIPLRAVSIAHFFAFPQQFYTLLPDLYEQYAHLFNQSPGKAETTVLEALN
jgi:Mlc titration factor MtfA (ptsG expression regulator)